MNGQRTVNGKNNEKEDKHETAIMKFFYELGQLKRAKRSGWWLANIDDPESMAEHTFRAAAIGYVLAKMEGANPERTALIMLFHDIHEARVNDLHKLGQRYIDMSGPETEASKEQLAGLPKSIRAPLEDMFLEFNKRETKEAVVAKDADLLECAIQAKEYKEVGYKECEDWIVNVGKRLQTGSAKRIYAEMRSLSLGSWWHGKKKILPEDEFKGEEG